MEQSTDECFTYRSLQLNVFEQVSLGKFAYHINIMSIFSFVYKYSFDYIFVLLFWLNALNSGNGLILAEIGYFSVKTEIFLKIV